MKDNSTIFTRSERDANLSTIGSDENRDCAVRAVANLFDIDYLIVHSIMKTLGRKDKRGTDRNVTMRTIKTLCSKLNYEYKETVLPIAMRTTTIADANKNNPTARILMFTKRHVMAFVNGKIHDTFLDERHVNTIVSIHKIIDYSLLNLNEPDMATSIKNMTTDERSKLINELSERIMRKTFTKDDERDKAVHLLKLLSKYDASDYVDESAPIQFNEEFKLEL